MPTDTADPPRRGRHVEAVDAGHEVVLVDRRRGALHLLNPTAAEVWSLIDGSASLDRMAHDLATAHHAPPDLVRRDVATLLDGLADLGLLEGGGPPGPPTDAGLDPETGSPASRGPDEGPPVVLGASPASPHLDARFHHDEGAVVVVAAGGLAVEVRIDQRDAADRLPQFLEAPLAARLGRDLPGGWTADVEPWTRRRQAGGGSGEPAFTLLVGRPRGPVRDLHVRFRQGVRSRRTASLPEALHGIAVEVAAVLGRALAPRGCVTGIGLTRKGRAVVIDPMFAGSVDRLERRLRSRGITRLDQPFHPCRPGPEPTVDAEGHELRLAAVGVRRSVGPRTSPGRVRRRARRAGHGAARRPRRPERGDGGVPRRARPADGAERPCRGRAAHRPGARARRSLR